MIANKKVASIVCEFNPFHNGHKYHIEKTREITCADYIICIMSGSMVQRGEVAITDKWQRAKTAVENGADLVIELPAYYVLQSAENFAFGGVSILDKLGVVDYLSFGSETGDVDALCRYADMLLNPSKDFNDVLKKYLDDGFGYPYAMEQAFKTTMQYVELKPNDILAINYIKALKQLDSKIKPATVKRTNDYHGITASGNVVSATAVRELINNEGDISAFVPNVPKNVFDGDKLEALILGFFRLCRKEDLSDIIGMEQGLPERLISLAKQSTNLLEFINNATTKRYTTHRIKRVIMCSLLGIKKEYECNYARILASNKKGFELISKIKEISDVEIITKTADYNAPSDSTFKFDIRATDIAALCSDDESKKIAMSDFTHSPEIIS
jgi:predicted nucleotidyltransferase